MDVTLNVINAHNFTATALIYGFHGGNITSAFIRKLYDFKRLKSLSLSFTLNNEYIKMEED